MQVDLQVIYRPTSELTPYENNTRTHSKGQIEKIAASIQEFGFVNPILVDGSSGIIAGHGRLAAAQKLGLEQVPVIELGHLDDAQKRALVIADNRIAEEAGWDEQLLGLELKRLMNEDFDVSVTGFDEEAARMIETMLLADAARPTELDALIEKADIGKIELCPTCGRQK